MHTGQTHLNSVIHAQQGFQPLVTKINNRQNLCPVSILKIRCACPEVHTAIVPLTIKLVDVIYTTLLIKMITNKQYPMIDVMDTIY